MRIVSRAYASDADFLAMRKLVVEAWQVTGPHFEWTVGDLARRMFRFLELDPRTAIQLFEDEAGTLAAFVWVDQRVGFDVAVHPKMNAPSVIQSYSPGLEKNIAAMKSCGFGRSRATQA